MPNLIDNGLASIVTTTGAIGVGWKLNFYETGTTVRKDTYPTEADATAETNANSNPIVLDTSGRVPPAWLTSGRAKCVLTDENGTVKKTIDPINDDYEVDPTTYTIGTYGERTTLTVIDGETVNAIAPQIYIDPINGSDSNDGESQSSAFASVTGLLTHSLMGATGTAIAPTIVRNVTIGIVGHLTEVFDLDLNFFDQTALNGYRQMHAGAFVAVGPHPVQIDCADDVPGGAIAAHGSVAGAYTTSWSHSMTGETVSRFRVWNTNNKPLRRVETTKFAGGVFTTSTTNGSPTITVTAVVSGALAVGMPVTGAGIPAATTILALGTGTGGTGTYTLSANATATAAGVAVTATPRPGTYTYAGNPVTGVAKTIDWFPYTGDTSAARITRRDRAIGMRGGLVQDIWGSRNGHNSGAIEVGRSTGQTGDPSSLRAVLCFDGTKHNVVWGHGECVDLYAVNCHDDDYDPGADVPALLTLAQTDLSGEHATMTRCAAIADTSIWGSGIKVGQSIATSFLTHDSGAGQALSTLALVDCYNIGLPNGWGLAANDMMTVTGHYSPLLTNSSSATHLYIGAGDTANITRSFLGGGAAVYRWIEGTDVTVTSSLLIQNQFFSGGGITSVNLTATFDISNNFVVLEAGAAPFIDMSANNVVLRVNRNAIINGAEPITILGPTFTLTGDRNTFVGDGGANIYTVTNGTSRTFANAVAALGIDANGSVETTAAGVGFLSGAYPTLASPDIRPVVGGTIQQRMTDPITQDEITAMQARPTTLAAVQAYLRLDPNGAKRPVLAS